MNVLTLPDGQSSIEVNTTYGSAGIMLRAVPLLPGGGVLQVNTIAATAGQTAFLTSLPPGSAVMLFVNGVQYQQPTDYTVAGSNVTWLDVDFVLSNGDQVQLVYDV